MLNVKPMVLEHLFAPSFFICPPPVYPYFYPSTMVSTCPNDGSLHNAVVLSGIKQLVQSNRLMASVVIIT